MDKITINLNPEKENISSITLQKLFSYTRLIKISTIGILILILILHSFVLKKERIDKVYSKKWSEWESKFDLIKEIKTELLSLENEKEKVQEVVTLNYKMAFILGNIFSSLPKNIWFDSLNFEDSFITLRGYVVKWKEDCLVSVDKFINSLRKKEYFSSKFSKMNIRESRKTDFNGREVLWVIIECKK